MRGDDACEQTRLRHTTRLIRSSAGWLFAGAVFYVITVREEKGRGGILFTGGSAPRRVPAGG